MASVRTVGEPLFMRIVALDETMMPTGPTLIVTPMAPVRRSWRTFAGWQYTRGLPRVVRARPGGRVSAT